MNIKGKKLLILGGNAISCEIVSAAKSLGLYTIVTDWNSPEDSPAKLIADEYWNDSLMDYDILVPKILNHHIDGIITGFADSYLLPYQKLCELTGLPCYATKEVFETTMDKSRFKQLCRENDVPVIPEYELDSFNTQMISKTNKVIIKPVDNSGSRGVVICESPSDFDNCLNYSLSFSIQKKVIIEKYMELDSISASYTIQDGELSLSTLNDRYVHKATDGGSVTCLSIYPSKYSDQYLEILNDKVITMYKNAGVRNGMLSLQFFTDGTHFYAMEMGHRLTGGQHYTYSKMENGISSLDCLLHFSVTGKMADYPISMRDNARFRNTYCHLYILGKQARIAKIDGLDYLENRPNTISISKMKKEGDMIGKEGTSSSKIVGLHLKIQDRKDLNHVLEEIYEHFHVYDVNGKDIVIKKWPFNQKMQR